MVTTWEVVANGGLAQTLWIFSSANGTTVDQIGLQPINIYEWKKVHWFKVRSKTD